jgi:hypothetical protein
VSPRALVGAHAGTDAFYSRACQLEVRGQMGLTLAVVALERPLGVIACGIQVLPGRKCAAHNGETIGAACPLRTRP